MAFYPQRRQARREFLLAAAGLLALAGCSTGRPSERPPEPVAPPPPPRVEAPPTGHNRVALLVPLTGANGPVGQSIANAASLALVDSGERSLRLTVYDSSQSGAAAAAQRALAEGNRLILGPLLAEDVRAVAPIARAAGAPVIAYSNDSAVAGDGVFILGVVPSQAIHRVVSYARGKGAQRFAGLVPTGLYGQRSAQALLGSAQRSGGRVSALETYNRSPAGVRTAARALAAKGPFDAVLVADSGRIAAVAVPLVKQGPSLTARILGTELWGNERTIGAQPALRGAWYAAVPNRRFDQLVTRYRARYGKTPYRLASLGYDSMLLTVRSAKNWSLGGKFPARQLVDRDGFVGIDGIFRFGRDGVVQRSLEVRQVTESGSTVLSPAATSFGD